MTTITALTDLQQMNLEIFRMVQNDTAAAEKAISFVAGNQLNYELFKDQYHLAGAESSPVSRTDKAIREAKEALDLFSTGE